METWSRESTMPMTFLGSYIVEISIVDVQFDHQM